MGAYVSIAECQSHYNLTINCTADFSSPNRSEHTIGGFGRYEVPADPDIAGVGIVWTFIAVTSLALVLSIMDVLWMIAKFLNWKYQYPPDQVIEKKEQRWWGFSLSKFCETVVMACSDQQVFTGGAYALTLRYWKGCEITAYHYNIVSNMMLLTCATHLMSVTITRNYWRYPFLGVLRVFLVTGLFIVSGILLSNQNAQENPLVGRFPTAIPPENQWNNTMFLPAACFQSNSSLLIGTLAESTRDQEQTRKTLLESRPDNRIQGWNFFIIILFWYIFAFTVDVVRFFRRGIEKRKPDGSPGFRNKVCNKALACLCVPRKNEDTTNKKLGLKNLFMSLFCLYLLGGVAISAATVILSAQYITGLRTWAKYSGWLAISKGNQSAEDDATSFGQLVPTFVCLLVIFSMLQVVNEMSKKHSDIVYSKGGSILFDPSSSKLLLPTEKPSPYVGVEGGFTPTPGLTPGTPAFGGWPLPQQHHSYASVPQNSGHASPRPGPHPHQSPNPQQTHNSHQSHNSQQTHHSQQAHNSHQSHNSQQNLHHQQTQSPHHTPYQSPHPQQQSPRPQQSPRHYQGRSH
ncbi:hypothetical protein B0H63DRAFT_455721 [Podospora didyma]|uniref:Uncharacterized protein n=1 Tax=Podospora didyma TaxID=330526 RepID=A0AAE0K0Y4_9PEZI|nr:hypothetical protein B0H63DRAFT_455721 [Podospora didyma]